MFDVDIKGPTMKEIFGNINSVVDPREWKTLDKVNKENFAFTAGFEALKYIMNKIKMNIPVEKKRDYAMEMIAKDGTINKFIQKWDPEIIPELSRYIFQNGSKLLNFKIVDYLKTTPEYGKQAVGLESVKEEIRYYMDFIKNKAKYADWDVKLPKGILLAGPPGTGKTLLVKTMAENLDIPVVSMCGSEFVEMYVGVGASRVRKLFANAKRKKKCIIFID